MVAKSVYAQGCLRFQVWFPWDVTKKRGKTEENAEFDTLTTWKMHANVSCQMKVSVPVQSPALCGSGLGLGRKSPEAEFSPFSPLNSTVLPSHHCTIRGFLLQVNSSQLHTGVLICIAPAVGTFLRISSQDTFNIFPVDWASTCPAAPKEGIKLF